MRLILGILAILATLNAQDSLEISSESAGSPLDQYLRELHEMGCTLSGWKGEKEVLDSWFFGSYAMLLLRNNGNSDIEPYPTLAAAVPGLWSDFKYLTPRYLVELAGGTLSNGNLMSITRSEPFNALRTEEQFILHVAGFGYLKMLQETVGDSLFNEVVRGCIGSSTEPSEITGQLIANINKYCEPGLGGQFAMALLSSRWADVGIERIKSSPDSLEIHIKHHESWHFPVDVLVITGNGDSTILNYGLNRQSPLIIPRSDIKAVVLDPYHNLAEYYRFNNKWPRLEDNIHVQPFGALPDWSSYRITVSPSIWRDWDDEKRYGIKFTSGLGVDLWPAYPSDFRHRLNLEFNAHVPYDQENNWGGRLTYGHPLNLGKRLFSQASLHNYDDWRGMSVGLTRYVGDQSFLIQGPRLTYQRIKLDMELDTYADTTIWKQDQKIHILKASYTGLRLTRTGDRLYFKIRGASGEGYAGGFSLFKSQVDLAGVGWGWLAGGMQFVAGFQSNATPDPYQFTHNYAWQDGLSALPNFRGQTKIDHSTNNYMGLSISAGYYFSGLQFKLFTSSMILDMDEVGWTSVKPRYASGFGFEHRSFFTAGLYFPVWQSHPLEDEEPWGWRYQWRLTWNL